MSVQLGQNRICKRVTKQRLPCRKRALIGTDYCFVHNVSQKHGWGYYVGLVGSITSVIGLIVYFLQGPNPPNLLSSTSPSVSKRHIVPRVAGQDECISNIEAVVVYQQADNLYPNNPNQLKFQLLITNSIKINLDGTSTWDDRLVLQKGTSFYSKFRFSIEPGKQGNFYVYYRTKQPDLIKAFTIRVDYKDLEDSAKCIYASYPP
jgi:hypothetical protein